MRLTALALMAALAPAPLLADAHAGGDGTVVATVNGTEITIADLKATLATLPQQYQQLPPEVLLPGLIDQVVQQTAIVSTLDDVPAEIEARIAAERRNLVAAEVLRRHLDEAVTDADIEAAYAARIEDFEGAEEFNAAHILVETEEEAQAVVEALEGGADFAELARERSTGPSGPRGGDLGWFGTGAMVPEFEAAVLELEEGEVSPPVQTQFGWHIVTLLGTRTQSAPGLEQIRPEIERELQNAEIESFVAGIADAAEVERVDGLDPALLVAE